MISTILAQTARAGAGGSSAFMQLVDVLAQGRGEGDKALLDHAYATLESLRRVVPAEVRARMARTLVHYNPPARLVRVFAEDAPRDVAPLFTTIKLSEGDWRALIPELSPPLRMLVRERRDLPDAVRRDVDAFGPADMVLSAPSHIIEQEWASGEGDAREIPDTGRVERLFSEAPVAGEAQAEAPGDPGIDAGQEQIRDLLARIEAFRTRGKPAEPPPPPMVEPPAAPQPARDENEEAGEATPEPVHAPASGDFRWESDAIGQIVWVEGVERAAFIGRSVAVPAVELDDGVDAGAASAFQQRAPFRDARLAIPGAAPFSGEWRLSGVPFFDPRDGRFTGFRGTARRPRPDEVRQAAPLATAAPPEPARKPLSADGIRQMVHELRTPLNAIMGFAEMIERQMLGPAAQGYRERAGDILAEARRLLGAVEDLDVAARSGRSEARVADFAAVVGTVVERYRPLARNRGVTIDATIAGDLPAVAAGGEAMDRLVGRLLASVLAMARAGEGLTLGLEANGEDGVRLSLSRPAALMERGEAELLDPELRVDDLGKEAPALGLSFGLRLVRQLVQSLGGALRFEADAFILDLPAADRIAERRDDAR